MQRRPDEHPFDNDPLDDNHFDEHLLQWFITLVEELSWEENDDAADS